MRRALPVLLLVGCAEMLAARTDPASAQTVTDRLHRAIVDGNQREMRDLFSGEVTYELRFTDTECAASFGDHGVVAQRDRLWPRFAACLSTIEGIADAIWVSSLANDPRIEPSERPRVQVWSGVTDPAVVSIAFR